LKAERIKLVWVPNAVAGHCVPPKVNWLIERLAKESSDKEKIVDGAFLLFAAWLAREHRADNKGHKLLGSRRRRPEKLDASAGPTDELERLQVTARGGSEKEFTRRWLATSGFVRKLVMQMDQPITEKQYDQHGKLVGFRRKSIDASGMKLVKAGRFTALIPRANDALPNIQAALATLRSTPPGEIKRIRAKAVEITDAQFAGVIREVYEGLTGKVGISYDSSKSRLRDTRLIALWRDIDAELGAATYGKKGRIKKPKKKAVKKSQ
jgi:hypothetical protein